MEEGKQTKEKLKEGDVTGGKGRNIVYREAARRCILRERKRKEGHRL